MPLVVKTAFVLTPVEQVAKILTAAKHQRVSDHFTKQQRRNIEMWLNMTEVRNKYWFSRRFHDIVLNAGSIKSSRHTEHRNKQCSYVYTYVCSTTEFFFKGMSSKLSLSCIHLCMFNGVVYFFKGNVIRTLGKNLACSGRDKCA